MSVFFVRGCRPLVPGLELNGGGCRHSGRPTEEKSASALLLNLGFASFSMYNFVDTFLST